MTANITLRGFSMYERTNDSTYAKQPRTALPPRMLCVVSKCQGVRQPKWNIRKLAEYLHLRTHCLYRQCSRRSIVFIHLKSTLLKFTSFIAAILATRRDKFHRRSIIDCLP